MAAESTINMPGNTHPPRHAYADFAEALVVIGGDTEGTRHPNAGFWSVRCRGIAQPRALDPALVIYTFAVIFATCVVNQYDVRLDKPPTSGCWDRSWRN